MRGSARRGTARMARHGCNAQLGGVVAKSSRRKASKDGRDSVKATIVAEDPIARCIKQCEDMIANLNRLTMRDVSLKAKA